MEKEESLRQTTEEVTPNTQSLALQAFPIDPISQHQTPKKKAENRGGVRRGAGRPTRKKEGNITEIFNEAMKGVYRKRCSRLAKIEFAKKLLTFERGQIFVAEHIFGKAVQRTDLTTGGESLIIPILNNDSLEDEKL
tara:strand:+ start:128 stop:538 length:411 start_codon:yes stop_codon:yes gene_type:complete